VSPALDQPVNDGLPCWARAALALPGPVPPPPPPPPPHWDGLAAGLGDDDELGSAVAIGNVALLLGDASAAAVEDGADGVAYALGDGLGELVEHVGLGDEAGLGCPMLGLGPGPGAACEESAAG